MEVTIRVEQEEEDEDAAINAKYVICI